jgi:hypothetical protein
MLASPPATRFTVVEIDPETPLPPEVAPWTTRCSFVESTSFSEETRTYLITTGGVAALACVVVLALGIGWGIAALPAALAVLWLGVRGPDRSIDGVESPRGRFVLLPDAPAEPIDVGEERPLDRFGRKLTEDTGRVLAGGMMGGALAAALGAGPWVVALAFVGGAVGILELPAKAVALLDSRSVDAPPSKAFLAAADPRVPLGPDGRGPATTTPPRVVPEEAFRGIGRVISPAEYMEVRRLMGLGVDEGEACLIARALTVARGEAMYNPAIFPADPAELIALSPRARALCGAFGSGFVVVAVAVLGAWLVEVPDRSPLGLLLTFFIAAGVGGTLIYQAGRTLDTPDVSSLPAAREPVLPRLSPGSPAGMGLPSGQDDAGLQHPRSNR